MKRHSILVTSIIIGMGILAISTAAIFIRYAQMAEVPSMLIAAARMVLAAVLLAPFVISGSLREIRAISLKNWYLLVGAGLILAVHMACWVASLEMTSVVTSVVVVTSAPLWVGLFSYTILKEKIQPLLTVGLCLALMGGVLIGLNQNVPVRAVTEGNGAGQGVWGILLALIGALCSAGYLIIGRVARRTISLPVYTFLVYGIAGLFLVVALLFFQPSFASLSGSAILWLILLALIPQLIGHSSFNWALKYSSPVLVSIALLGEPVGAGVLALIFLGEVPSWLEAAGALLILSGIVIAIVSEKTKTKGARPVNPRDGR